MRSLAALCLVGLVGAGLGEGERLGGSYFGHSASLARRLGALREDLEEGGSTLAAAPQAFAAASFPWMDALTDPRAALDDLAKDPGLMDTFEAIFNMPIDNLACLMDLLYFVQSASSYGNATLTVCEPTDCACAQEKAARRAAAGWVLRVVDSWGKLPAAFLSGDTFWLGDFKECRKVSSTGQVSLSIGLLEIPPTPASFHGQYCSLELPVSFDLTGSVESRGACASPTADPLSKGRKLKQNSILRYGLCVPDSCSQGDINQLLQFNVSSLLTNLTLPQVKASVVCHTPSNDMLKTDGFAIFMICLCGFFGLLLLIGTAYEYLDYGPRSRAFPVKAAAGEISRPEFYASLSGFQKALLAFSVLGNGEKLLSMEPKPGQLDCIHGIRFISMTWVMLGHTYYFAANYIGNVLDFMQILKEFSSQAVLNATVSVDSFFVISGLLMTYLFLSQTNKKRGANLRSPYHWVMYYVHRYIRLTPVYALVLGLDIGLFKYLTDGPLWKQGGVETNNCKDSWYYNLLYVNNFFGVDDLCMGHSWYLAIDMQIYWVAPPILVLFYYFAPAAMAILGLLICVHLGLNAYVEWDWNFPPNGAWTLAPQQFSQNPLVGLWYFKYDYITTYTRCGTYCIGMLFGYALYRIAKRKGSLRYPIHKGLNLAIWLVMAAVASWVLYGLWPISRGDISSEAFNIFYASTNRLLWGVAVGWVVFACVTGNGGPVNALLSSPLLFPFSRLTYCAYLIHPFVMYLVYQGGDRAVHFDSHFTMVYYFFAHFTVAYALAFVLSLAFESPILTLEKLLLPRDSSGPRPAKPPPAAASTYIAPAETLEARVAGRGAESGTEMKVAPRTPPTPSESTGRPPSVEKLGPRNPWHSIAFPSRPATRASMLYENSDPSNSPPSRAYTESSEGSSGQGSPRRPSPGLPRGADNQAFVEEQRF